ncbi:MAG: CDGSH iron-sulfur domain-containing protein [Candidatus Eremiobacteraeota bacterium]|nr:CDGSH iron-sulfur domain-containing protein [Candidatus Eremiobacteraeota bacterium]
MRDETHERNARTTIRPETDGPYIVRNLRKLTNSLGETLPVRPIVALCRCGGSNLKPYCDGTHARIGFSSAKSADRTPDRLDRYDGESIVVFDNRGTCCHFGNCTDHLSAVFHHDGEPFVTPDGAPPEAVIDIVRACPSGALGYAKDGVTYAGESRDPEIYVAHDASYYVRGGIELEGEPRNRGASREHYALCRCGKSKNKPFCDGSHWYAHFEDPEN